MLIWLVWVVGFGRLECIVFVFMKSDKYNIWVEIKVKDCCWRGDSMEFARADDAINMPASLQCRACSSACSLPDLRFIFSDSSVMDRRIAEVMAYVTGLQIARSDGLPDQICRACISLAESAALFKEQCCRADANFRSLLSKVRDGGHSTDIKREEDCPVEMEIQEYTETSLTNSRHIIKEDSIDSSGVDVNSQEASERDAPYQCAVCSLRFLLCSKLKEHIKSEHGDMPKRKSLKMKVTKSKFSCPLCSKAFRSLTTYNSHYRRCENKSLQPKKSKEKKIKEEMVSSDSDTPLAENVHFDDLHSDSESIPMKEIPIETFDEISVDNPAIKTENQSAPVLAPIGSDEIKSEITKKNKSYTCEECEMSFTWKMFAVHMKIEHSTDITEKPTKYRKGSKKSHKNNGMLEKKKSKKRKSESSDATAQMDITWNGDDNSGEDGKDLKTAVPYSCTLCERKFSKSTALSLHLKKHEDQLSEVHSCLTCKREFKRKAHLDNHILTHSVEKGFKCTLCDKAFARQDSLSMHIANHEGIKKHQCNFCDKGFNMLSTLKDHIRTHTGEKPFLCSICGRGFSQSTNLKEHVRRHQGYKPFKCSFCAQTFVSKGELEAHTRKHSGAHPFVCDVCGGGFTTSSSLVKHKRIHTGERPYQCDFCPMRFTALGTLKNHRRTHTGEKPYKCIYCDKAFAQKNDLVSHTRTHTGERPYVCSVCSHAFRQSSALKTHFKIHGGMSEQDASRLDMACIKVPDPMLIITGLGPTVSKISDDNNSSMNLMTPKSETSQQ